MLRSSVCAVFYLFFLFSVLLPGYYSSLFARNKHSVLGKFGNTYVIEEKDAYDEILEKVRQKNLDRLFLSLSKKIPDHYVVNVKGLKKAKRDATRYHTLTYTLPFDIKDQNGNIIYPAGFTFNPLDYVKLPYIIVFFDATSKEELSWIKKSGFLERWDVIFVAVKGNIYDAGLLLGRTVYAGSENVLKYLGIESVPSYVYQEGNRLIIREVGVYKK